MEAGRLLTLTIVTADTASSFTLLYPTSALGCEYSFIDMFTPIETSIGALLLHQATSVLLFQNGTVLGASGYMRRFFSTPTRETLAFFVGMAASVLPLKLFLPELVTIYPPVPSTLQAALVTVGVGALVGWGTKVNILLRSGQSRG